MSRISTDQTKIDHALSYAVERVFPSVEAVTERFRSGKQLTVFLGIDPTGPTLHLGHLVPIRKLAEFQALGHKVILLVGDFTAMIGDPTDKTAVRKQQTREEVMENCRSYKEQASKFLSFDGENPAELRFNSAWLEKLTFADVISLASNVTVQQMLERDMFARRMEEGKPIHLHEFLYPLMQGYDSVAMHVDGEVGGNDQTFNMLAGRDLARALEGSEKFVLAVKLLTDSTGKKMGKSEGNMLALSDAPEDMYGKVMRWTDEMILPGFRLCTNATEEEVEEIAATMSGGENPMRFKAELAHRITSLLVDVEAADHAAEMFQRVHQEHERPVDVPDLIVSEKSISLVDALVLASFVSSKTDARRQIEQGGVKVDDVVVSDPNMSIQVTSEGVVIQKGKRHFVRLRSTV